MKKKSQEEVDRAGIAKTTRTLIRLKHSLVADQEINDILPAKISTYDAALARGKAKTQDIPELPAVDA